MFTKSSIGWLKHYDFILLDLLCLQISFLIAYMLRHNGGIPYTNPLYLDMAIFLVFCDIVVTFFYNTFHGVLRRGYYKEFAKTFNHVLFIEMFSAFFLVTRQEAEEYSRIVLYVTGVIYFVLTYLVRIIWKNRLKKRKNIKNSRSFLIVTSSDLIEKAIFNFRKDNYENIILTGLVITDQDLTGEIILDVPVVANKDTAIDYICSSWVDEVFIALPRDTKLADELVQSFSETGIITHLYLARLENVIGEKQLVEKIGNYTVLTTSMNYMSPAQAFAKRTLDIIGGLFGCIFTAIIFIFLAPPIYIKSPGPIFFSQIRVGKNGRKFKLYKFRSMYLDAEERKQELMEQNRIKDGKMFKLDFDPRVIGNEILPNGKRKTGIGEFIRKTSLDEFPQFWNVLKGDLSLVGTRPPLIDEVKEYAPNHHARLAIKPGLTGMWQVSGRSEITDFDEVVKLDTQYINEWSVGLDLRILLKTVKVVLKREGSM